MTGPTATRLPPRADAVAVAVALTVFLLCGLWATWPAVRQLDDAYLARPAASFGEAAAGDHLQLGWSFWLVGHQLERGGSPLADPYSFRPESSAAPNLQGWALGAPYWPLSRAFGNVWAYNLVVLLTFVLAGGLTAWWLRALGLGRPAALVGGLVFALAPYRVGQSTGHLLGLIAFLLPALLLALERRRFGLAALALCAIPLSGQPHLALGAIPLALGYGWARVPRQHWRRVALAVLAGAAAGVLVAVVVVDGSVAAGRSFAQVEHYSATLADFVRRAPDHGIERFVFLGWLTPLLALAGVAFVRGRGLRLLLVLAAAVPCLLALGANLPGYHALWRVAPGLGSTRVPERLLPIACLAIAALVAFAIERAKHLVLQRRKVAGVALAAVIAAIAIDLRVSVFGAVAPDRATPVYAAISGGGRLLELPVFRPEIHFGSVYLAYARQSPRERPQGYSTVARPAAVRFAQAHRGLSCGRGTVPATIDWVVVHRGLYRQSGFFAAGCAAAAEAALLASGWAPLARDGALSLWRRPTAR